MLCDVGEYNGEQWACSGLDVVTEIYDCGEIGKKKKQRREKVEKKILCGNRSAATAAVYTHARPT